MRRRPSPAASQRAPQQNTDDEDEREIDLAVVSEPSAEIPQAISFEDIAHRYRTKEQVLAAIREIEPTFHKEAALVKLQNSLCKRLNEALADKDAALKALTSDSAEGSPEPIEFYKDHFNYVDRVDLLISFLKHGIRTDSVSFVWLMYLVRLAVVQIYSTTAPGSWVLEPIDYRKYRQDREYRATISSEQREFIKIVCAKLQAEIMAYENETFAV